MLRLLALPLTVAISCWRATRFIPAARTRWDKPGGSPSLGNLIFYQSYLHGRVCAVEGRVWEMKDIFGGSSIHDLPNDSPVQTLLRRGTTALSVVLSLA